MIEIFCAENNREWDIEQSKSYISQLPKQVIDKATRFVRWQDRQAYILGRVLLLHGLKQLELNHLSLADIKLTNYNKPILPGIEFNISHADGFVLCAFSSEYLIGIDIEAIREIEVNDFQSQFTHEEMEMIRTSENPLKTFYTFWTIKEAVIKADGRGLGIPLKEIKITDSILAEGKVWYHYPLDIHPDYVSHIVTNKIITEPILVHTLPDK